MINDNINTLIELLEINISSTQPSERWAMYRLITPVVDYANKDLNLTAFFEYNQTSNHNRPQSVDIALLDGKDEIVLIEAKGVEREVNSGHIKKYLAQAPKARGVVTNGIKWILCYNNKNCLIPLSNSKDKVNIDNIRVIIDFIRGKNINSLKWEDSKILIKKRDSVVRTKQIAKSIRGQRIDNYKIRIFNNQEFKHFLRTIQLKELEKVFLQSIVNSINDNKSFKNVYFEGRKSRVSFFDSTIIGRSKRVARIELGRNNPDILLLTDRHNKKRAKINKIISSEIHSKGDHMRRYRLANSEQSKRFGKLFTKIIMESEK